MKRIDNYWHKCHKLERMASRSAQGFVRAHCVGALVLPGRGAGKEQMLISEIREEVSVHKKCSYQQLRRYMATLRIEPVGCRQRPQPYPDDAAKRILAHLGVDLAKGPTPVANGHKGNPSDGRVPSLHRLKQVRAKARRAA